MRRRMIDPAIWESEQVMSLSPVEFKIYVRLISQADDEGRTKLSYPMIRSGAFPMDDTITAKDIQQAVEGMDAIGLVVIYTVDGVTYLAHPNWKRWQTLNRPTTSRIPPPPGECEDSLSTHGGLNQPPQGLNEDSLSTHGGLTEDSLSTHGGLTPKRREEKGREGKGYRKRCDLTDEQRSELDRHLKGDLKELISRMEDWIASKGKAGYKDWAAAIRNWAKKDGVWISSPPSPKRTHCPKCGESLGNYTSACYNPQCFWEEGDDERG